MSETDLSVLLRQFRTASRLTRYHLETLTDAECLWRPAGKGLHVWQNADGAWRADWPESEAYSIGPPSIAWLTWHIGFWWSSVIDYSFGEGALHREQVLWPGSAAAARLWIEGLETRWLAHVEALTPADLASTRLTRWPFSGRPFADVIGWVSLELTKNAAEIGYARFLYAARLQH